MTDKPIVTQSAPITNPQFLLAAWSVTTPAYVKYNYVPYTDTPRKGESRRVYRRTKAA